MSDSSYDETPLAVVEFTRGLMRLLAEQHGGDTTLNELRIMNQLILCLLKGCRCSVTALHNVTGIPMPTVSRIVTHLKAEGWLSERADPDDGRKRIITLGPHCVNETSGAVDDLVDWVEEFRKWGLSA